MKFKIGIIMAFLMLLLIFALQNTEIVTIKLMFWEAQTPKAILIFACLVIGLFIGFLVPSSSKKKKQEVKEEAKKPEQPTMNQNLL